MTRKILLFTVLLLCSHFIKAQDKIIKSNNEEIRGKIILFQNGRFTMLLADKSELTFPKDGIKEIQFDTSKCSALSFVLISGKEADMEPDCDSKNVGNFVFINKTGAGLRLSIYKQGSDSDPKSFNLSKAEDPVKFYGFESGSYLWKTDMGINASGGLFIPKCKTALPVTIK